ncbi:MAG: transcriptional regulator [Tenericutes bacterium HGW-Tenericutes-6]|nr:MAG: transcriptional regulator [Tenericutes bacterium HGW-Tenericutes-6]
MNQTEHQNHAHIHQDKINQLLKTSRGQIEGILKMYADGRYCVDISKQILSVIAMLQNANALILNDHINTCVKEAILDQKGKEKIDEITEILVKYLR